MYFDHSVFVSTYRRTEYLEHHPLLVCLVPDVPDGVVSGADHPLHELLLPKTCLPDLVRAPHRQEWDLHYIRTGKQL